MIYVDVNLNVFVVNVNMRSKIIIKKKKYFVIVIKLKENLFGVINFFQIEYKKNYFLI